jgi:hypothetical protein
MSDVHKEIDNSGCFNTACGENHPNFGETLSEETKLRISDANQGENHYNFGKTLSEETRKKISDAKFGQPRSAGAVKPSQQISVTDMPSQ